MKVISWCLFINPDDLDSSQDCQEPTRIAEYLVGLKINKCAAELWFPDWELRLYVDPKLKLLDKVWSFVVDIASSGDKNIEIIDCRDDANPTWERYRVLCDEKIEVCLIRDVDSILSKTDADLVCDWLQNDSKNILIYKEHKQQCGMTMGGGFGAKKGAFSIDTLPFLENDGFSGRGDDEWMLALLVNTTIPEKHQVYVTRMTTHGVYCLKNNELSTDSVENNILWPVPFYWEHNGYAWNTLHCNLAGIVDFATLETIRSQHIYSHLEQHRVSIINGCKWVR